MRWITETGAQLLIRQLTGWPPSKFQAADFKGVFDPPKADRLELQAASLIPSIGQPDGTEVFLLLKDPGTELHCSTRLKVKDVGTAIKLVRALAPCRDKSLAEVGDLELQDGDGRFPGLRKIL